jgi:hypothetical protein
MLNFSLGIDECTGIPPSNDSEGWIDVAPSRDGKPVMPRFYARIPPVAKMAVFRVSNVSHGAPFEPRASGDDAR